MAGRAAAQIKAGSRSYGYIVSAQKAGSSYGSKESKSLNYMIMISRLLSSASREGIVNNSEAAAGLNKKPAAAASSSSSSSTSEQQNMDTNTNNTKPMQWWRPDPATGVWVPENQEGSLLSTDGLKDLPQQRARSVPRASLEERAWWTSMEELPDRHYT